MDEGLSLRHSRWECKYHIVFIPKCRRKVLYGQLRNDLGEVLRALARHKESRIEEGHLMVDHVHMLISIPPKYAVSSVVGYIKIHIALRVIRYIQSRNLGLSDGVWRAAIYDMVVLPEYQGNGIGPKFRD